MRNLPGMGRSWGRTSRLVMGILVTSAIASSAAADPPTTYPHKSIVRKQLERGGHAYWLFEPAEPTPESAPVVVFNHGWFQVNPGAYGAWIEHLVLSGRVVIYPRYQADAFTDPDEFLGNAVFAVQDALEVLETGRGHVRPDRDRFAVIGHSAGGNLAAQMATVAKEAGLPRFKAVLSMLPGEVQPMRDADLADMPAETLLVVTVAENDLVVGDVRARQIFNRTVLVPKNRKKFILFRSDTHGMPRLMAHHLSPTAALPALDSGEGMLRGFQMSQAEVNAFDRAGYWRIADLTMEAAFAGRTLDDATQKGELFRNLGYWSDGRPVNRPIVGDDLSLIPRVYPVNGLKLLDWWPDAPLAPADHPVIDPALIPASLPRPVSPR